MTERSVNGEAPCPGCGFERVLVGAASVPGRVTAAVDAMVDQIGGAGDLAGRRPAPDRWSALEYGGHLRDVLLSLRERTLLAAIEEHPTGTPIHRDERVNLGFYHLDTPGEVCSELTLACGLYLRTRAALPEGYAARALLYSPVTPEDVTIAWLGTQAVHECEHHLGDVRENLRRLAPG